MEKYKILTKSSVLEIQDQIGDLSNDLQQQALQDLYEEQFNFINGEYFVIHFIEDENYINENYTTTNNLDDTIQRLAIKEGIDIVQFDNGNMGFMAYYNGNENAFEFKKITEDQYYKLDDRNEIKKLFM